jgi:cation transport ATPase
MLSNDSKSEEKEQIGICVECKVRNNDVTEKRLYQCKWCDRWFCEEHLEPRITFIRDLKRVVKSPAQRAFFYEEWKRKDGHPDFAFSQTRIKELEIEGKMSSQLIEKSLDKSRPRFKTAPKYNSTYPEKPSRSNRSLRVNWRSKKLLLSLKLWFPVFLVTVFIVLLMEDSNPTKLYQNTPDLVKYGLFIFATVIGIWSGYRVFDKCDYNPHSDRGLFGMKLLAVGIFVLSFFIFVYGFFLYGFFLIQQQQSLGVDTISIFLIVLSFVLMVTSAYLIFKFQRRSGIIIYSR